MPPIPSSPIDGEDALNPEEGISPLLSRAPPFPLHLPTTATHLAPPLHYNPPPSPAPSTNSAIDDSIAPEHKRIPALIPRSPLSPIRLRGFLSSSSSRDRRNGLESKRKPVPPPIVVVHPLREKGVRGFEKVLSPDVVSAKGSLGVLTPPPGGYDDDGKGAGAGVMGRGKSKRRTVWQAVVEGWWDLGLLERMNTVRRKR
ncbi:hypothetical protein VTI74DRAFT_10351 [Chaetomium olivicolor]